MGSVTQKLEQEMDLGVQLWQKNWTGSSFGSKKWMHLTKSGFGPLSVSQKWAQSSLFGQFRLNSVLFDQKWTQSILGQPKVHGLVLMWVA